MRAWVSHPMYSGSQRTQRFELLDFPPPDNPASSPPQANSTYFPESVAMKITDHLYLFTVADRFSIAGRGTVVVPGIPHSLQEPLIRRGAPLILRTPLGDIMETYLQDFEMINYREGTKRLEATPISLPDLNKFDIPIGTEVYLRLIGLEVLRDGVKTAQHPTPHVLPSRNAPSRASGSETIGGVE